jgi:hypothetical protein
MKLTDMNTALEFLVEAIRADYITMWKDADIDSKPHLQEMIDDFWSNITVEEGRKYIKIIKGDGQSRSVWGFVVKGTDDKKFRQGDILKAASWATPARNHARGNIFDGYSVAWTGPHYM